MAQFTPENFHLVTDESGNLICEDNKILLGTINGKFHLKLYFYNINLTFPQKFSF